MPAAFTTIQSPSCSAATVDGLNENCSAGGGAGAGVQPLRSSVALTVCGTNRVPPLATVAIITASDSGVTETCPCPMATEIVSPAYHFSPVRAFFHAVDGMMPCTSFGRSMPVRTPSPRRVAHLCIRSTPSMLPSV